MKKIVILFVLALTLSQTISATVIPVQKARNLASAFFAEKGKTIVETSLTRSNDIHSETEESQPYYIINSQNDKGFVIVSGSS